MSVLTTNHADNGLAALMLVDSREWSAYQHCNTSGHSLHPAQPGQLTLLTLVRWKLTCCTIAILTTLLACTPRPSFATWKTGEEFQRRLRERVTISWDQANLRDALMRLADAQSVAIFLDRRVDPQAHVSIQLDNVTLDEAIRQIARQKRLGVGYVGPVVYLGPARAAARVATLAEMRREDGEHLPEELRARMNKVQAMQWPRLSEPRWIVRKLCAEAGVTLADADAIAHDLWPAYDFPEMSLHQRLTLVLANFGFTYRVDEKQQTLNLVAIPRAVAVEKHYTTNDAQSEADVLAKQFPQANIRTMADTIVVQSTMEDHWAIARALGAGQAAPEPTPLTSQRFTLTVKQQPMGWLCEQVGKRVGLSVEFSDQSQDALQQRVSFTVEKVTLQELFESIVQPAGLEVTIEPDVVRIR